MATEPKIYANGMWVTEKEFDSYSIIKVSCKVDKLIEFLNQHKNEKGYTNIILAKRKSEGQGGETHYAYLDTWKPTGERRQAPQHQREQKPSEASGDFPERAADDDVPF